MSKKHHQVMNAINELVYECLTKIKEVCSLMRSDRIVLSNV